MSGTRLVEAGHGSTLLCLHGISSSSSTFAPQLEGLSGSLRVVAWDAPGYGASDDLDAPTSIESYAAAAIKVLESLPGPAHLLGASWGGVIAAAVAFARPDLLRSLLLVSASRGSGRDPKSAAAMRDRADQLDAEGPEAFARSRGPGLLSPAASPALVGAVISEMTAALHPSGYRRATEAMAGCDITSLVKRISTPTLLLCGAEDSITGPAEAERLAAGIPGAVTVILRRAGHLAHRESPVSCNAWIEAFVDIVDGTTREAPTESVQAWT